MIVRPALLYGVESWSIKKPHIQRIRVAQMRMIHWMYGHTRFAKTRNEVIRDKIEVTSTEDKIREAILR